jgi:hypothetical protein
MNTFYGIVPSFEIASTADVTEDSFYYLLK